MISTRSQFTIILIFFQDVRGRPPLNDITNGIQHLTILSYFHSIHICVQTTFYTDSVPRPTDQGEDHRYVTSRMVYLKKETVLEAVPALLTCFNLLNRLRPTRLIWPVSLKHDLESLACIVVATKQPVSRSVQLLFMKLPILLPVSKLRISSLDLGKPSEIDLKVFFIADGIQLLFFSPLHLASSVEAGCWRLINVFIGYSLLPAKIFSSRYELRKPPTLPTPSPLSVSPPSMVSSNKGSSTPENTSTHTAVKPRPLSLYFMYVEFCFISLNSEFCRTGGAKALSLQVLLLLPSSHCFPAQNLLDHAFEGMHMHRLLTKRLSIIFGKTACACNDDDD
ncbi:hypothetical protein Tco_0123184 [Tanacetum coccineum]